MRRQRGKPGPIAAENASLAVLVGYGHRNAQER
ncbi:hypothetical protein HD597_000275 [Nonomuraea thailandensis]|uniref:Uncharacterized protein n=1 Tax=Nonomuraea thailandensis TaxID=1188745 RepID=A0A9X2G906_9ACTN|nr:hypothetical protein [Nonomuraea thailandensis]